LVAASEWRGGPEPDPDSAPATEPPLVVPLSARGNFQFIGALPGRHVLNVDCAAASGSRELIVQADGETRINPPIRLEEQTLEIAVTPALDPLGHPWKLTVEATTPRLRPIADHLALAPDGSWTRRGLMAGNYRITLRNSEGTPWLQRNFELGARSGPLLMRAASVPVTGRVMLGEQSVRARLLFFNQAGGEPVPFRSDTNGRFQGMLPIPPGARETSWTVEAQVAQPSSTRRIAGVNVTSPAGGAGAWLDLALPLIALRGTVVSQDGKPERNMEVKFEDSSGRRTTTSTDDAGNFEMPELPAGKYTALAESEEGESDRMSFDVLDGSEKELTLVVRPSRRVAFQVLSHQEPVADAAVQVWIDPGVPRAFVRTDQNGRFHVKLPRETAGVGLTVGAPGYAVKMTRAAITNSGDAAESPIRIELGVRGGTLELSFEPPEGDLGDGAMLYLAHDGAIQDARTIAGWGTDQARSNSDGPAVVETIEPGDYALCTVIDPSELAAVWMGTLPPNFCRVGTVKTGQSLTLAPLAPRPTPDRSGAQ
jgi:hypothetical protein